MTEREITRHGQLLSFASEVAEVLSEWGNGTTDEDISALRDLAFSVAPDWTAEDVPTRAELLATIAELRGSACECGYVLECPSGCKQD